MPLKIQVSYARKVGQPDYGSAGATCGVELEADSGLLEHAPAAFGDRVRFAFDACRRAVDEELAREQPMAHGAASEGHRPGPNGRPVGPAPEEPTSASNASGRPASEKQSKAIRAIARRHGADLEGILRRDFGVERPEELSVAQASELIDALKAEARI